MKAKVKIIRRPNLSDWSWDEIIANYIPPTWREIFEKTQDERQDIAKMISEEVTKHRELFPQKEHIYRAFDLTPFPDLKVVIIGQDPYPQRADNKTLPKAQGLSFSVAPYDSIPKSLQNIFQEIKREYPNDFKMPSHGDLSSWARQGVLLLNMALTVPPFERNKHRGIWFPFIAKTVKEIVNKKPEVIFVLWGQEAKRIKKQLGNNPTLESGHPSPEAVYRGGDFIGNNHFRKINELLTKQNKQPIDWQV